MKANCPKCKNLLLSSSYEWLEMSEECLSHLQQIRKVPTIETVQQFYFKFGSYGFIFLLFRLADGGTSIGHVFATQTYLGGALRWSQATSEINGNSDEKKASNFMASVKANFPETNFSGSYSANVDSQHETQSIVSHHIRNFTRIGGKSGFPLKYVPSTSSKYDSY